MRNIVLPTPWHSDEIILVPGGVGRDRGMVALGGDIADGRLGGLDFRAHVHGYPRATEPSPLLAKSRASEYMTTLVE